MLELELGLELVELGLGLGLVVERGKNAATQLHVGTSHPAHSS